MLKIFFSTFLAFGVLVINAQNNANIIGSIQDNTQNGIPSATVLLEISFLDKLLKEATSSNHTL